MENITLKTARRFVLLKQGLLGPRRFAGAQGAREYVRQCGCIQYDPVDVCGRNAELTLQSRVRGFGKQTLRDLLYRDRLLFDYPDKEIAILCVEDWPCFERYRALSRENGRRFEQMAALEQTALDHIRANGPADSAALPIKGKTRWHSAIHWSGEWHGETNAARAALEQLYAAGALVIHHKDGSRKTYDLAERCLPAALLAAPDPLPDDEDHIRWRVLRRIGAVGLLWNRRSDAFLGIWNLDNPRRDAAFGALLRDGRVREVSVEGVPVPLYLRAEDMPLLERAASQEAFRPRCEFLAPLDPMLWDRRLIQALFSFSYSWEIYTPPEKRRYGHYVLPVLYGERFIGRIEAVAKYREGALEVRNLWLEEGVKRTRALQSAVDGAIRRFARFNGCGEIIPPRTGAV